MYSYVFIKQTVQKIEGVSFGNSGLLKKKIKGKGIFITCVEEVCHKNRSS